MAKMVKKTSKVTVDAQKLAKLADKAVISQRDRVLASMLLKAAQDVVNDAGAYDGRGTNADDLCVVGRPEIDALRAIVREIG